MAQKVMIASGKGGTGKSTAASYISLELAFAGKKVLLVELDAGMRSIDVICGVTGEAVFDLSDVLTGKCPVQKAAVKSPYSENLSVITAPYKADMTGFDNYKSLVASADSDFDFIVTDTRAGLGVPFRTACAVSDVGIIVVTPDVISVRDGRLVSDEIFDAGIPDIRLIINKFSPETFKYSGLDDFDRIIDDVCARLLGVIPMSAKIAASAIGGVQLGANDKEKIIFKAIADRLLGREIQILV